MKKFLFTSLILHLLPIFFLLPKIDTRPIPEKTQVGSELVEIEIPVEKEEGDGEAPQRKFYWGIGIMTTDVYHLEYGFIIKVVNVYKGYSAMDAGLLVDDLIVLVDGKPITQNNDIKGDGPHSLSLTILRKDDMIKINLSRVKVYY